MHIQRAGHLVVLVAASILLCAFGTEASAFTQPLSVGGGGRFLVKADGTPFFWMGDTNWRLYKLNPDQVNTYLDDRQAKGFNVIQGPVLLHNSYDIEFRDAYGHGNTNPTQPNEAYFGTIDQIIDAADARGMYVAPVAVWGDSLDALGSTTGQRIANARWFGEWLGDRYRNRSNVIWIVGGEFNIHGTGNDVRQIWNALAEGLQDGSGGNALITIHASYQPGLQSSSTMFHDEQWLSFNMIQSSQSGNNGSGSDNWRLVNTDWALNPRKPVIDGEAHYEGLAGWNAFGVRRRAYWSVFAGAFGHTYGSIPVAVSYRGGADTNYYGNPDLWSEGLDYPGASDMKHLRRLMESRPMLRRIPADEMLLTPAGSTPDRLIATRDKNRRYAMVYAPKKNKTFTVYTAALAGSQIRGWWYDCRTGRSRNAGIFNNGGSGFRTFTTPNQGQDWVLVLDDVSQGFPRPGVGGPLP